MEKNEQKTIIIGDREIPLAMSCWEVQTIQDEVGCKVGQIWDDVFGIEKNMETGGYTYGIVDDGAKLRKFGKLIKVLGNAGLEEAGQEPDLDDKWIVKHMKPAMVIVYVLAVALFIKEAMSLESDKKDSEPVDEILEEENRKKEPES